MKETGFWKLIFTGRNELRQGNVFTPVGHSVHRRGVCHTPSGQTCDLNSSVRARVSSSRTSFFTPPNLKSEVSTPKICVLTASASTTRCQHYWYTFQGKVYLLGGCTCKLILGVDTSDLRFRDVQRFGHLRLKVRRCKKTCANTELFRIHGQAPPGRHPPCAVHAGIQSTSGQYASYWNAILLTRFSPCFVYIL